MTEEMRTRLLMAMGFITACQHDMHPHQQENLYEMVLKPLEDLVGLEIPKHFLIIPKNTLPDA